MRKYSAIFALILTLWGTFSPLGISIVTSAAARRENIQQNSAVAIKLTTNKAFAQTPPSQQNSNTTTNNTGISTDAYTNVSTAGQGAVASTAGNTDSASCAPFDILCQFFTLIIDFLLFIPNGIMTISGLFMDIAMGTSINPVMYGVPGGVIETGLRSAWAVVRDFANIGFIFALFVIAFSLILNKNLMNFDPKKGLIKVIMMALLINFSFLMCRLIIQTADVFSHLLYSKITVTASDPSLGNGINLGNLASAVGIQSPSLAIVNNVNPQRILLKEMNANPDATQISGVAATALGTAVGGYYGGWQGAAAGGLTGFWTFRFKNAAFYIQYGIVGVVSFFIYLILIFTFVSTGIIFLGRIFGLWIAMILSPLAFVSYSIPSLEKNKYFGFENWLNGLIQLAFTTPVFLFFIYLAVKVLYLKDALLPPNLAGTDMGIIPTMLASLLPALGAMFIILKGKKIATDMSGEIGAFVSGMTGTLTGLALGAATGGTALAARQTFGRAGAAVANRYRGDNSFTGKNMRNLGDKLGASSFDVRKNERAMKGFSAFTGAAGEKIDLGTRGLREGGFNAEGTLSEQYRKKQEEIAKAQEEKLFKESEAARLNAQAADAQKLRENQSKLDLAEKAKQAEDAKIAMEAENQPPDKAYIDKKTADASDASKDDLTKMKDQKIVIQAAQVDLESEKTTLTAAEKTLAEEKDVITKDIEGLEKELATAAPEHKGDIEANIKFKKEELATKETEIKENSKALKATGVAITAKKKELEKKDADITKKEGDIAKATIAGTVLSDVKNVRDARQKRKDLELEATHSLEKEEMDKEKTDMEEKDKKRKEKQNEYNELKKKLDNTKDEAKRKEIEREMEEVETDVNKKDKDYNDAKAKHASIKVKYDLKYGNQIKVLEDFEKDGIKSYLGRKDVVDRKQKVRLNVVAAQKSVNASQNNIDNLNYQFQQKYADDLEKNNPSGGWRETLGTISGGNIKGGSVRGAANNGAARTRENITGK